ncbi:uncharacterized protein J4E79_008606 [Alternaria viburni]|uniref:uncharacterized protein n=1 Tax=Alternaria viburni TaxID=566460 RepID=UPI0020C2AE01|nr:uncharacterized protein J4E79_008606 [Alternaria viburni]KAI4653093.1 hypothetical protein J4E79_008606 [Alternaria viburni]
MTANNDTRWAEALRGLSTAFNDLRLAEPELNERIAANQAEITESYGLWQSKHAAVHGATYDQGLAELVDYLQNERPQDMYLQGMVTEYLVEGVQLPIRALVCQQRVRAALEAKLACLERLLPFMEVITAKSNDPPATTSQASPATSSQAPPSTTSQPPAKKQKSTVSGGTASVITPPSKNKLPAWASQPQPYPNHASVDSPENEPTTPLQQSLAGLTQRPQSLPITPSAPSLGGPVPPHPPQLPQITLPTPNVEGSTPALPPPTRNEITFKVPEQTLLEHFDRLTEEMGAMPEVLRDAILLSS